MSKKTKRDKRRLEPQAKELAAQKKAEQSIKRDQPLIKYYEFTVYSKGGKANG